MRVARVELARAWCSTDFLTTIVFTTLSVCGLDYTFTIPFGLGVPRLVSTPSRFLLLGSVLPFYRFHRIWGITLIKFPKWGSIFISLVCLPIPPYSRVWDHYNSKSHSGQVLLAWIEHASGELWVRCIHQIAKGARYECLDSNQVKAANLAERVYKTPLTTKSHSHKPKSIIEDLELFVKQKSKSHLYEDQK